MCPGTGRSISEARRFRRLLARFTVFGVGTVLLDVPSVATALVSQVIDAIFFILILLLKLTDDEEGIGKHTNCPVFKRVTPA